MKEAEKLAIASEGIRGMKEYLRSERDKHLKDLRSLPDLVNIRYVQGSLFVVEEILSIVDEL